VDTLSDDQLFDPFLDSEPIFKDREVLRPSYTPEELPHRDEQIDQLASVLVAAVRGDTPSNVFIYGKTGTGKTACTKYVNNELVDAGQKRDVPIHYIYVNCEVVDTQYRVLTHITNHLITEWDERVPFTGWPTDEVYAKLRDRLRDREGIVVIVLDEVDNLVFKDGDGLLYNLCRINEDLETAKVSLIGISNDLRFTDFLDPRVRSSLGEEEIVFPPYNAEQLRDILQQRAEMGFNEGRLEDDVIPLCAAFAAQEHGDARRALDLLRVAGELTEREGAAKTTQDHVRKAQNKIELDRITEVVRTLPMQSKILLLAILLGEESGMADGKRQALITGEVYEVYEELCEQADVDVLTQRRITDLISELDMLGLINAQVKSKGRYGRTKEIQMSVPIDGTKSVLRENPTVDEIADYDPNRQTTLI
jgi:cell division control protein 6